jgi:hypothetical protein
MNPYKFNDKKKEAYLENLRDGFRRGAAAESVGVSRVTVFFHKRADPDFAKACEDAEMVAHEIVEDALFNKAAAGDVTACQVWLYNRLPGRWKDKRAIEHSGPGGGPIETRSIINDRAAKYAEAEALLDGRIGQPLGIESGANGQANGVSHNGQT